MMTPEERELFNKFSEAAETSNFINYTPEQLRAYDLYLDNIRVRETGLAIAKKRGIEEGRIEGREEGKKQVQMEIFLIISELKKMELTIEQIANKYGVTQEKIFEIKKLIS
jgi:predicted transposase/invertase (TIGR01784 family)